MSVWLNKTSASIPGPLLNPSRSPPVQVFSKAKNMEIDPDKLEDFFEATEDWNSAMNMSNSMAFISQFGEYNPGGGKDEVLKYLNESKKQVELASKALKTIMDCLDIVP